MTRYALLVRGINVGGKNKVVMAVLRQELTEFGLENVETYINSGNIFFNSTDAKAQLVEKLEAFFAVHYPFIQSFSILSHEDYEEELKNLPDLVDQRPSSKRCPLLHRGLGCGSSHRESEQFGTER